MLHAFESRRRFEAPSVRREAGFSLIEILLALGLTALLMMVASQLIVSMKRSSDRMRINAEAKNRAQQALDYLTMNFRGATDMNPLVGNPAAIMTWYQRGGNPVQATWNNVTNANLADIGTDILTIARAGSNTIATGSSFSSTDSSTPSKFEFNLGCPNSANNLAMFKDLTSNGQPTLLVDRTTGTWALYQITDYRDAANAASCGAVAPAVPEIEVIANPGGGALVAPAVAPGAFANPPSLMLGVRFFSFRIRNGWLEQKQGLFDPNSDNPGTAFIPLIPNIEDLQIAWAFTDGTVWNSATQQLAGGTYTNGVPSQGTALAYDVLNVNAFRVTVVARSQEELKWDPVAVFSRPSVEDRAAGAKDKFFHQRAATLVMIRNRNLIF
jgi:type II secretory pathway pseudopilin PulG